MNLQDVPYNNLFEEFVRRVAEYPGRNRLRPGVAVERVVEEFYEEFRCRTQAISKELGK